MKIASGLFDRMVLQRDRRNFSRAVVTGEAATPGTVKATVRRNGRTVKGLCDTAIGRSRRGWFDGTLSGVPVGGPYEIELRIEDAAARGSERITVRDVLVGDVWVLGGQSNMQGCGLLRNGAKPHPDVRACYMDDHWGVAKDPIHDLHYAIDRVHAERRGGVLPPPSTVTGVGPGVSFGVEMHRLTGVPQGLIACAHGGTSMAEWDPKLKNRGDRSFYGATLRRFRKFGGRVAGVAWYQGCSDAGPATAPLYPERMRALIRALRRDFGDPRLPFVMVQIATYCSTTMDLSAWNDIQDMQRRLQETMSRCSVVPAVDLPLEDIIHLNGPAQVALGKRMAQAMHQLQAGARAGKPPIMLKAISLRNDPQNVCARIVVEFANVMGRLQSEGRPTGFTLLDPAPAAGVFDVQLERNCVVLRTALSRIEAESKFLSYGHGFMPYCNITDSAGRSLPVFKAVPISKPTALTPFFRTMSVSRLLPGKGKLHGLDCPKDLATAGMKRMQFAGNFCDLHLDIGATAPEDRLAYYAGRMECSEPMKLAALIGYDGPVKMWVDGKEVFHDPNGTNPAYPDMKAARFRAARGSHDVVVALGTNGGQAWGIYLRFQRLDVSRSQLRKGPLFYAVPELRA